MRSIQYICLAEGSLTDALYIVSIESCMRRTYEAEEYNVEEKAMTEKQCLMTEVSQVQLRKKLQQLWF